MPLDKLALPITSTLPMSAACHGAGNTAWLEPADREHPTQPAKLLLATSVWIVYAIVLHSPINPSFRGRKTAILSVLGFLLMVGTIVAVEF